MSKKVLKKIENEAEVKLTIKQARFFEEWLKNGGNGTQAAMKVYDTTEYASAGQIAYENLRKLENPMKFYMEHKGIGIGKITQIISEAMDATKWNDFTGEREADHAIRLRAVERVTKMTGMETEKPQQQIQNNNMFVIKVEDY